MSEFHLAGYFRGPLIAQRRIPKKKTQLFVETRARRAHHLRKPRCSDIRSLGQRRKLVGRRSGHLFRTVRIKMPKRKDRTILSLDIGGEIIALLLIDIQYLFIGLKIQRALQQKIENIRAHGWRPVLDVICALLTELGNFEGQRAERSGKTVPLQDKPIRDQIRHKGVLQPVTGV